MGDFRPQAIDPHSSVPLLLDTSAPETPFTLSPARADQIFLQESLRHSLNPRTVRAEPLTAAWFLQMEQLRYARQAPWLPRLLEFGRHAGESVLGLGSSFGTDWAHYAQAGANVSVMVTDLEQLAIVRHNFEARGLSARFRIAEMDSLPVESESIDVICSFGLKSGAEVESLAEFRRVLRPGGKLLAILPAYRNVTFWRRLVMPWTRWWSKPAINAPRRFTAKELRCQFSWLQGHRIHKRLLTRAELPALWRGLPVSLLERMMGRWLIWKAFKPVRSEQVRSEAA